MSKILVLSSIYPAPDIKIANNTNVVHYFAQEWVKQGHEVMVVHNYPVYMRVFHLFAGIASKMIASKFNTSVTAIYQSKDVEFKMDGVKVIRMPLYKPFPRFGISEKVMNRQVEKIAKWCNNNNFNPDVITSHNFYPYIEMVNMLKGEFFHKATTCVVVHKQVYRMFNFMKGDYHDQLKKVDVIGYRSLPLKREFESFTGYVPKRQFMCYSGIPAHFLGSKKLCNINKPITRFVYVGSFIRRKYPEKLLQAIQKCDLQDFRLDYVGDGANRTIIEHIVKKHGWEDKVTLHGFVKREQVPFFISKAQCFIMISEEETFGLVYLEAMSLGCITIASRYEGMEGIIENGVNGFLCKAGDENELAQIIDKINNMEQNELDMISKNAILTAQRLTDSKVAKDYIDSIINA